MRKRQRFLGYSLFLVVARFVAFCWWRLRVFGRGRLPAAGGFLIASNHQSALDAVAIGLAAGNRGVDFMARSDLFRAPFGCILRAFGVFPVRRGHADRAAVEEAVRRLRAGRPLALFPEGTRSRTGAIGKFRRGVATIALRAGVPVVPAAVRGAFEAMPPGARWPRRGRITVRFGEPLAPPATKQEARLFQERLREEVLRLYAQEERDGPVPRVQESRS